MFARCRPMFSILYVAELLQVVINYRIERFIPNSQRAIKPNGHIVPLLRNAACWLVKHAGQSQRYWEMEMSGPKIHDDGDGERDRDRDGQRGRTEPWLYKALALQGLSLCICTVKAIYALVSPSKLCAKSRLNDSPNLFRSKSVLRGR